MASNGVTEVKPKDSGKPHRDPSHSGEQGGEEEADGKSGPTSNGGNKGVGKPGVVKRGGKKPPPWKRRQEAKSASANGSSSEQKPNSSSVINYKGRYHGSTPTTRNASHNIEVSQYILLVREVYQMLVKQDPKMIDSCPYPIFQHACCTLLNAYICDFAGRELRYGPCTSERPVLEQLRASEILLPVPLFDFIVGIGNSVSPADEIIHVNIPAQAIPNAQFRVQGQQDVIEAGTFGQVTAERHNLYECYIAPAVTARFVTSTLANNIAVQFDEAWEPLPRVLYNRLLSPTPNLLGYWPIERQSQAALNALQACQFKNDNYILGRLRYSKSVMEIYGLAMSTMKETMDVRYCDFVFQETQALFIYKTPQDLNADNVPSTSRLCNYSAKLESPYAFGASAANRAHFFGYKRRRGNNAVGSCFVVTADNTVPPGWADTANSNFTQHGIFAPAEQLDAYGNLRDACHHEINTAGRMLQELNLWVTRNTVKLK